MDHGYIESNHLADRYVLGQLSERETDAFEKHFLQCRECQDLLEQRTALRDGLRLVAAEDAAKPAPASFLDGLRRLLPAFPRYALALGVCLLPALLVFLLMREQTTAPAAPRTDTALMMLDLQRGDAAPSRLEYRGDAGLLVLAFPVSGLNYDSYGLEISEAEDRTLWRAENLSPNLSGLIVVTVPSDFLTLPSQSVRVIGKGAAGTAVLAEYELVIKPGH